MLNGYAGDQTMGIFNAGIDTLATALVERVFYCEVDGKLLGFPYVDQEHVNHTLKHQFRALTRRMRGCTMISPEQFVQTYRGPKQRLYERARIEYYTRGVCRNDSISCSFVKIEKGNVSKAPRCIQPRGPVYNLALGMYIKPIEHRMYNAIAHMFGDGPTVMKGYNVNDIGRIARGKWDSFTDPVAVGLDAKRFDAHVSKAVLSWEHSIYAQIFNNDPTLSELLRWQLYNVGKGYCYDGKLKYTVVGKRFSGDMNTALGNCIIMCAMIHSYSKSVRVPTKLLNNGDDCTVFMERKHLSTFISGVEDWFYSLGFRMTVETPVYHLEEVEFCQMHPVWVDGEYKMVRNLVKTIEKDVMCTLPLQSAGVLGKWLQSIGDCGMSLCPGVPIMQEFYATLRRSGALNTSRSPSEAFKRTIFANSGVRFLCAGLSPKWLDVSERTRFSFWLAFGVTPDQQKLIETNMKLKSTEFMEDPNFVPNIYLW